MKYNKDWLLEEIKTNNVKFTRFFTGADFMSNFYKSEMKYDYKGREYTLFCSEHLFMSLKAIHFEHEQSIKGILAMGNRHPSVYKKIGRKLPNYDKYGPSWEAKRDAYMYEAVEAKFSQNEYLKRRLLDTGRNVLVEASPYDKYWGAGFGKASRSIYDPTLWPGENRLGFILMELRDNLKDQ